MDKRIERTRARHELARPAMGTIFLRCRWPLGARHELARPVMGTIFLRCRWPLGKTTTTKTLAIKKTFDLN